MIGVKEVDCYLIKKTIIITVIAIAVGLGAAVVILNVIMKAQSNLDKMSNVVITPAPTHYYAEVS